MNCPICNTSSIRLLRAIEGYRQGTHFDVFECQSCWVSWSSPLQADEKIYDTIYKNVTHIPGYQRYFDLAELIEKSKNPLNLISRTEDSYHAVVQILKAEQREKQKLRVAEIGCGQGYLTYALSTGGFDVTGIDISANAIDRARTRFGEHFFKGTLQDFVQHQNGLRPTHVVCTELIEHIQDPIAFLQGILDCLEPGGKLIVTTPHKHEGTRLTWNTDLPPVHLWWFSKHSMQKMGQALGCKVSFFEFDKYYKDNDIRHSLATEPEVLRQPTLSNDFKVIQPISRDPWSNVKKLIKGFLPKTLANNIRNRRRGLTESPVLTDATSNTLCAIYQRN